jgi:glycerol uptake facilitator-like aquaporin
LERISEAQCRCSICRGRVHHGSVLVTASTSFANPAVTLARAFTDTFTGIRPVDVPGFVGGQIVGAAAATALFRWLIPTLPESADRVVVPHTHADSTEVRDAIRHL